MKQIYVVMGSVSGYIHLMQFLDDVTAGSLLVVLLVSRSYAGTFGTAPTGWTKLDPIEANGFNSGNGCILYRFADGTEGNGPFTVDRGGGTQGRIVLAEFEMDGALTQSCPAGAGYCPE